MHGRWRFVVDFTAVGLRSPRPHRIRSFPAFGALGNFPPRTREFLYVLSADSGVRDYPVGDSLRTNPDSARASTGFTSSPAELHENSSRMP